MGLIIPIGRGQSLRHHAPAGVGWKTLDLNQFGNSQKQLFKKGMAKRLANNAAGCFRERGRQQRFNQLLH